MKRNKWTLYFATIIPHLLAGFLLGSVLLGYISGYGQTTEMVVLLIIGCAFIAISIFIDIRRGYHYALHIHYLCEQEKKKTRI